MKKIITIAILLITQISFGQIRTQKVTGLINLDSAFAVNGATITYYGKNVTNDSTIIVLSNGTRFAAALGSGGSSGTTSIQQFTLASGSPIASFTSVPATYADYEIFRWGVRLYPVTDYTTSGNNTTIIGGADGEPITFQRIK